MHWPYPIVWIVPIAAAVVAGSYLVDYLKNRGPGISIQFTDVSGLEAGRTPIQRLGVTIGTVRAIHLNGDQSNVIIEARLLRPAADFARQGARFWIVRPEISGGNLNGLNTLTSGPYIEADPGNGPPQSNFVGLDQPPSSQGPGLRVVLHSPRLDHLESGSPIMYRGLTVGSIDSVSLSPDSTGVDVHIFIQPHYAPLVHTNSAFWSVSGVDVKGGLFTGVQMKVDSLRSVLAGGIEFATPPTGEAATDGANFPLYEDSKPDWLKWETKIPIKPENSSLPDSTKPLPMAPDAAQSAVK